VCKNCGEDVVGPFTFVEGKQYCKECGEEMSNLLESMEKE
jgi:hypothetical protein